IFTDNCAASVSVSVLSTVTNGTPCDGQVIRTWVADDGCGNLTQVSQTNSVHDTRAPVAVSVPGPLTNQCLSAVSFPVTPSFTDNSEERRGGSELSTVTNGTACDGQVIRTWVADDG